LLQEFGDAWPVFEDELNYNIVVSLHDDAVSLKDCNDIVEHPGLS